MKSIGGYITVRDVTPAARDLKDAGQTAIRTIYATDRLTGMPVLLHLLPHRIDLPTLPEHSHLLPPTQLEQDGEQWFTVTELPHQAKLATQPAPAAQGVLAALVALHGAGQAHGFVSPEQFWRVDDKVLLTGAGLPWPTESTPAADLRALLAALYALGEVPAPLLVWPQPKTAQEMLALLENAEAEAHTPEEEESAPAAPPHDGSVIVIGGDDDEGAEAEAEEMAVAPAEALAVPPAPGQSGKVVALPRNRRQKKTAKRRATKEKKQRVGKRLVRAAPLPPQESPSCSFVPSAPAPAEPAAEITEDVSVTVVPTPAGTSSGPKLPPWLAQRLTEGQGQQQPEQPEKRETPAAPTSERLPPRRVAQPIRIGWDEDDSWRVIRTEPTAAPKAQPRPRFLPFWAVPALVAVALLGTVLWLGRQAPETPANAAAAASVPAPTTPAECCEVEFQVLGGKDEQTVEVRLMYAPEGVDLKRGTVLGQAPGRIEFPAAGEYSVAYVAKGYAPDFRYVRVPRKAPVKIRLGE